MTMYSHNKIIEFEGVVTEQTINTICQIAEQKFQLMKENINVRKKVMLAIVESIQNIYKHGLQDINSQFQIPNATISKFTVEKRDNSYHIVSINYIKNQEIHNLKSRLESVNSYGSKEIRSVYKHILLHGEYSKKGGAGLGIVLMKKTTSNKLNFHFKPVDESISCFLLDIKISAN